MKTFFTKTNYTKTAFAFLAVLFCLIIKAGSGFGQTIITFPTTTTWTCPAGVTSITVQCWGGGGAGGSARANGGSIAYALGGGGAGGAYAVKVISVIPGNTYTVTVGAAVNGTNSTTDNTVVDGNPSWFGSASTVYAEGGDGGVSRYITTNITANGAGGIASSAASIGTTIFKGGNGGTPPATTTSVPGGGGGSSAGTANNGNAGASGGAAGAAVAGGGAGGTGSNNTNGNAGSVPGGGGGGARSSTTTQYRGGTGAAGQVTITFTQLTYKSQINSINFGSSPWCAGETRSVAVSITNIGTATWTDANPDINVGLKWDSDPDYGSPPGNIGRQNAGGLAPGATAIYTFPVVTPVIASGIDHLNVDVVYEGISWFRDNNGGVGPGNPKVGNAQYLSSPITIVSTPAVPGVITGTTPQCPGLTGQQYSIASVTNATTYTWTVPAGWIITAGQGTTTLTVTTGTAGQNGNISVTAGNSCGTSAASTKAVTVNPGTPAVPGVITGTTPQCPGLTGQQYSIASVTNATTYTWTVPAGWIITAGQGTTTLTVTTGTAGQNGNISVTAGNSCGTSAASTKAVTVNPGTPAVPGVITGTTPQCPGLTGQQYSIASVTNATTYTWTVPAGWIITAGQGTTTLTVTTGTAGQNGNISVTAGNSCGTSAASTKAVTVNPGTPAVPGVITGTTPQCPGLTGQQYSIASVTNATTYTWTVPAGWIITAGQGTTTLTVTTGTAGQNGNISVTAGNSCGTSAASTKAVTVNPGTPAVPGVITGTTPQCPGLTGQQYSIASVTNATTYTWTVPAGWIITAGQGTTTLTVTTGTAGQNGNISVTAGNSCGTSAASTKAVTVNPGTPAVPGVITGTTPQCPGLTGQQYSIASVTNATTYTWTVPAGWIITAGQGTTTLTVTTGTAGQNGNISVTAGNSCGTSAASTKAVTVNPGTPAVPGVITGTTPQCPGLTGQQYSIASVTNATTYTWTVPAGWIITAGQGTTTLTVTTGTAGQNGNISVTAGNSCGTSAANVLPVVVNPTPVVTNNNNVSICNGDNTNIILTASTPSTFTWTLGTVSPNITGAVAGSGFAINQVLINSDLSLSGTVEYIVTPTSTDGGCPGNPYTITVTVNAPVAVVNQPVSDTTCATLPVSFTVSATGTGLTYQWYKDGVAISDNSDRTGTQTAELDIDQADAGDVGVYWVVVKGTSTCGDVVSDHVNLVINQSITINTQPQPQAVCSGGTVVFTINATSPTGVTYQWKKGTANVIDGTLGDGAIVSGATTNTLTITGVMAAEAATYNVVLASPGGDDCQVSNSKKVKLTVNPIPTVDAVSDVAICNGSNSAVIPLTGSVTGTVYNWTNSNPAIGLPASGTGNIPSFSATNTGNAPVTATITVTPTYTNAGNPNTTCAGTPITFNIEVDPTPAITATPTAQEICSGSQTSIALSSNVSIANFNWTVVQTGVIGASAGTGNIISQTLSTTGNVQGTAVYTITSSAYGCSNTKTVTVKVNPIPNVTATPLGKTICSGTSPSIALSSNVLGAVFNWTVVQTNVTGASNDVGSSINQVLTATTSVQGTAVYTVTPSFNGCSGTPLTVTIKVNPTPVITATPSTPSVCSGQATSIALSSNVTGSVFNWTVLSQTGASGATAGSGSTIAQTLTVTGTSPGTVVYRVTYTSGVGCDAVPVDIPVTVYPNVIITPSKQSICSGFPMAQITMSGAVPGSVISWTRSSLPAGVTSTTPASGNTLPISGSFTNTTATNATVIFTIIAKANTGNCQTTTKDTVIVYGSQLVAPVAGDGQTVCKNNDPQPLTATAASGVDGIISYQWQSSTISSSGPWTNINGATSLTYQPLTVGNNTPETWYRVVATSITCSSVTANSNSVDIQPGNKIGIDFTYGGNIPTSPVCPGGTYNYQIGGLIFGTLEFDWTADGTYINPANQSQSGIIGNFATFPFTTINNGTTTVTTTVSVLPIYHTFFTEACNGTPETFNITILPKVRAGILTGPSSVCIGQSGASFSSDGTTGGSWTSSNTSVATISGTGAITALSAGSTTITYKITTGCAAPVQVQTTLIVNPNVLAGTVNGTTPLCKGIISTYAQSGGVSGGTWSSSNPTVATVNSTTGAVTTINAGTTIIKYTVNSGCGSPVFNTKTLTVNDDVTAGNLSGSPTSICVNATTQFTTNGTSGGSWNSVDPSIATVDPSSGLVTGKTAGTTSIKYTVSGCNPLPAISSLSITVKPDASLALTSGSGTNNQQVCYGISMVPITYDFGGSAAGVSISGLPAGVTSSQSGSTITLSGSPTASGTYIISTSGGCTLVGLSGSITINTSSFTWTGVMNTNWNNFQNWCSGIVPNSTSVDVIIPNTTNKPILPIDITVHDISIAPGATLDLNGNTLTINGAYLGSGTLKGSITSGLKLNGNTGTIYFTPNVWPGAITNNYLKTLTINNGSGTATLGDSLNIASGNSSGYGNVTVTGGTLNANGNLTLKSNSSGTAVVGQSNGKILGEVTVERYIPELRAWRFIAAPFESSSQTIRDAWQEGVNNVGLGASFNQNPHPGFGTHITGNNNSSLGYDYNTTTNPSMRVWDSIANNWNVIQPPTISTGISSFDAYYLFVRGSRAVDLSQGQYAATDPTVLRMKGELNEKGIGSPLSINYKGAANNWIFVGNPYASPVDIKNLITNTNGIIADKFWVWDPKLSDPSWGTVGAYVTYAGGVMTPFGVGTSYPTATSIIQSGQGFLLLRDNSPTVPALAFNQSDKVSSQSNVFGLTGAKQVSKNPVFPVVYTNLFITGQQGLVLTDGVATAFDNNFSATVDENDAKKSWGYYENIAEARDNNVLAIEFRPQVKLTDTIFYKSYLRQIPYTFQIFTQNINAMPLTRAWLVDKYLNTKTEVNLQDTTLYSFTPNSDVKSYLDRFMLVFNRQLLTTPVPVTKVANQQDPNITGVANSTAVNAGNVSISPNPVTTAKNAMLRFSNMDKGNYEVVVHSAKGQKLAIKKIQHDGSNTFYPLPEGNGWSAGIYSVSVYNEDTKTTINLKLVISK